MTTLADITQASGPLPSVDTDALVLVTRWADASGVRVAATKQLALARAITESLRNARLTESAQARGTADRNAVAAERERCARTVERGLHRLASTVPAVVVLTDIARQIRGEAPPDIAALTPCKWCGAMNRDPARGCPVGTHGCDGHLIAHGNEPCDALDGCVRPRQHIAPCVPREPVVDAEVMCAYHACSLPAGHDGDHTRTNPPPAPTQPADGSWEAATAPPVPASLPTVRGVHPDLCVPVFRKLWRACVGAELAGATDNEIREMFVEYGRKHARGAIEAVGKNVRDGRVVAPGWGYFMSVLRNHTLGITKPGKRTSMQNAELHGVENRNRLFYEKNGFIE